MQPCISDALATVAKYIRFVMASVLMGIRSYFPTLYIATDTFLLSMCDVVRLFAGRWRAHNIEKCARPAEQLVLYEFEGCPYCKKVRETLSVLDLDHLVYPCPRETLMSYGVCLHSRYRPEVKKEGGVIMFPFLVDPSKNVKLYNSDDIIRYLWATYGAEATAPLNYRVAFWGPYLRCSLYICGFLRPCVDMGILRAGSKKPKEALELWGYESSPFVKRVRETLTMLETPYIMHVIPMGSVSKRDSFAKLHGDSISATRRKLGLVQVPFLKDANTNTEMFESSDIVKYLHATYKVSDVPPENWCNYSSTGKKD